MTEKDVQVQDESQDVVLSLGAFAMYLYKNEMEIALKEALRCSSVTKLVAISRYSGGKLTSYSRLFME